MVKNVLSKLKILACCRGKLLLKCAPSRKLQKKNTKIPNFGIQGHSRSSMLTPLVHDCAYLQPFLR